MQGSKRKRRKRPGYFLKGFYHWVGSSKSTRKQANRRDRHNTRRELHP